MRTLTEEFDYLVSHPGDINEHLKFLAKICTGKIVTEFGVRTGVSTTAFVYGRSKKLTSYDINAFSRYPVLKQQAEEIGVDFEFRVKNSLQILISPTDILFIDTLHTKEQLEAELKLHSEFVKPGGFIILHDTTTFGERGETGGRGIWYAVADFLNDHKNSWMVTNRFTNNNGLTVIQRLP